MRRHFVIALLLLVAGTAVHANSTLRVGSQVLSAGDSAGRVTELLGKPTSKSHARKSSSSRGGKRSRNAVNVSGGERWNYRRDGHYITVTLTDGRVSEIEDRAH